ncbi:hypothetical protein QVD17_08073 [Tagetes erecta]|uniref:Uncharacterized protein n=1 Tax=Tagetes erecta TaxID=13708 RepID=A0AAD8KYN8_TARER|nr:hypothetical protein QVD17_08073 [Tagetes erecta]
MCGAWGLLDGQLSRSDDLFRCDVTQAPRIGLCAPGGFETKDGGNKEVEKDFTYKVTVGTNFSFGVRVHGLESLRERVLVFLIFTRPREKRGPRGKAPGWGRAKYAFVELEGLMMKFPVFTVFKNCKSVSGFCRRF